MTLGKEIQNIVTKYEISYKDSRTPRIPLLKRWKNGYGYTGSDVCESPESLNEKIKTFLRHPYRFVGVRGTLIKKLTFEHVPDWGIEDPRWDEYHKENPMYHDYVHIKIKPVLHMEGDFQK